MLCRLYCDKMNVGELRGWKIEWSSPFREYRGVVVAVAEFVKATDSEEERQRQIITVKSFDLDENYVINVLSTRYTKIKPDLKSYIRYYIEEDIELKHGWTAQQCEQLAHECLNKLRDGADRVMKLEIQRYSSNRETMKELGTFLRQIISRHKQIHSNAEDDAGSQDGYEQDCDEEDDEDEGEDDGDDDEEDDEEEEEDGDEDDLDSDDEEEEAEDDETSESEEDDDDEDDEAENTKQAKISNQKKKTISLSDDLSTLTVKVTVLPNEVVRGFAVHLATGFADIMDSLTTEYSAVPAVYYTDPEGDKISIIAQSDFAYAVRTHLSIHGFRSHDMDAKAATGRGPLPLRLIADFRKMGNTPCPASSDISAGYSPNQQKTSVAADKDRESVVPPTRYDALTFESDAKSADSPATKNSKAKVGAKGMPRQLQAASDAVSNHSRSKSPGAMIWQRGEVIGSGSFGQVYAGIDLTSGKRIAVKEVSLGGSKREKDQAKALQQEVRVLSKLQHPNIIRYLGTEYAERTIRIFLELAPEGSVKDALNEFGALAEPLIRRYTYDIVCGLYYLHSKNFIHRDIKPSNLLLSRGRIKLADFGCSAVSSEASAFASEQGHYTVAGTAVYMAPEVMMSSTDNNNNNDNEDKGRPNEQTTGRKVNNETTHAIDDDEDDLYPSLRTNRTTHATNLSDAKEDDEDEQLYSSFNSPSRQISKSSMKSAVAVSQVNIEPFANDLTTTLKGYGKKADVWSLGVTLIELATGKAPYRNGAAAIFAVCVNKEVPRFPDRMSAASKSFLSRCLVLEVKERANCKELKQHEYLTEFTKSETDSRPLAPDDSFYRSITKVSLTADIKDRNSSSDMASSSYIKTSVSCLTFDPASTQNINELLAKADAAEQVELFGAATKMDSILGNRSLYGDDISRGDSCYVGHGAQFDEDDDDDSGCGHSQREIGYNDRSARPKTCPTATASTVPSVNQGKYSKTMACGNDGGVESDHDDSTNYLDYFESKK